MDIKRETSISIVDILIWRRTQSAGGLEYDLHTTSLMTIVHLGRTKWEQFYAITHVAFCLIEEYYYLLPMLHLPVSNLYS